MASFTHGGQQYMDCWIETTVRHKGGRNISGFYLAGHYANYEEAKKAFDAIMAKHPKSLTFITMLPDTKLNREQPGHSCPGL